jgi:hypothetical protein
VDFCGKLKARFPYLALYGGGRGKNRFGYKAGQQHGLFFYQFQISFSHSDHHGTFFCPWAGKEMRPNC